MCHSATHADSAVKLTTSTMSSVQCLSVTRYCTTLVCPFHVAAKRGVQLCYAMVSGRSLQSYPSPLIHECTNIASTHREIYEPYLSCLLHSWTPPEVPSTSPDNHCMQQSAPLSSHTEYNTREVHDPWCTMCNKHTHRWVIMYFTLFCTVGMSEWHAEAVMLLDRRFPLAAAVRVIFWIWCEAKIILYSKES